MINFFKSIYSFAPCCENYYFISFWSRLRHHVTWTDQSGGFLKIAQLGLKVKNRFQYIIIGRDPCMGECFSYINLPCYWTGYLLDVSLNFSQLTLQEIYGDQQRTLTFWPWNARWRKNEILFLFRVIVGLRINSDCELFRSCCSLCF